MPIRAISQNVSMLDMADMTIIIHQLYNDIGKSVVEPLHAGLPRKLTKFKLVTKCTGHEDLYFVYSSILFSRPR